MNKKVYVDLSQQDVQDIINAYEKDIEKFNKQKEVLDNIKNNNKRIIDYGFDYDGFNNVEDLKKLIDMLLDYARKNYELLEEIE